MALVPGRTVVLAPGRTAAGGSLDWAASCGKTQLAAYFAEALWRSREVDLLIWVVATSRACALSGYVEAATAAGCGYPGDAESVADRFVSWLRETSRPWLVVLDDLRDSADLEGLWPAGPAGRVLITAANPAAFSGDDRVATLPVREFSTREALSYLMGRLSADPDQRIGAIDLVTDLGSEPLALAHASAVITSSGLSCRDYREYFAQRRGQLAQAGHGELPAAAVTWTLSVEQAERLSAGTGAQFLLALAALLDGHRIPGAVFTTPAMCEYLARSRTGLTADPQRAWATLLGLERVGLVSIDPAPAVPTVRMNRVVQAAVRAAMPEEMLRRTANAAASAVLEAWPAEEPTAWAAAGLRACAASLWRAAGDLLWAAGSTHPLLLRAGRSMDGARLTGPAVSYWRELAAASDRTLGPGSPDTLTADSSLAGALLAAGRAAEAIARSQRVLASRARLFGPEHADTTVAQIDLGRALVAAGQPDAAVPVLEQAADTCARIRGDDHLLTVGAREELAGACRDAGKTDEAIGLYRRTLADRERIQGQRHPGTLTSRQRLGDAYLAEGRTKDAISQFKKVLADRERVLGPGHLDTVVARGNLASAYHAAGKMASAVRLYQEACAGYERVLGAAHPQTLACQVSLAHAYYAVGRLGDATTLLRETLERCGQALPPGDPLTQTVRQDLANIAG